MDLDIIIMLENLMKAAWPTRVTYSISIATPESDILCSNSYICIGVTAFGVKVIRTQVRTERTREY